MDRCFWDASLHSSDTLRPRKRTLTLQTQFQRNYSRSNTTPASLPPKATLSVGFPKSNKTSALGRLFVTDLPGASDLCSLRENEINSILTVGEKKPLRFAAVKGGYRFLSLQGDLLEAIKESYKFLKLKLTQGNVLVNCCCGNQACAIAIAFLILHFNIDYPEAHQLVKDSRESCSILSCFRSLLTRLRVMHIN